MAREAAQEIKCDVAVIGGGVIGLSCAWRLAQGGAKVALFKRKDNRKSASWAAAGMLAPVIEAARHAPENANARDAMLQLGLQSKALYRTFQEELKNLTGQDFSLSSNLTMDDSDAGFVYLATDSRDHTPQRLKTETQHAHLLTCDRFSEAEAMLFKATACELAQDGRAFWLPQEGWVQNRQLLQALLKVLTHQNVRIYNEPVTAVEAQDNRVRSIATAQRKIECNQVLLCAGAWSGGSEKQIEGLPDDCVPPVHPIKGHILTLSKPHGVFSKVIYTSDFYLVPRPHGLLIGATMEERGDWWRDARGVWELLDAVQKVFPKLLDQKINAHWTGIRPATPDGLPILGRTPLENLFVATGHFRNGILLTPITAQLIADCLLNGKEPPKEFSLARFHS